jgi:hypothetical protein
LIVAMYLPWSVPVEEFYLDRGRAVLYCGHLCRVAG